MSDDIRFLLEQVKNGQVDVDAALLKLKMKPIEDLGYANVDLHRQLRQGVPEVIYGAGKTSEQIVGIISSMQSNGQGHILITRLAPDVAAEVQEHHSLTYIRPLMPPGIPQVCTYKPKHGFRSWDHRYASRRNGPRARMPWCCVFPSRIFPAATTVPPMWALA